MLIVVLGAARQAQADEGARSAKPTGTLQSTSGGTAEGAGSATPEFGAGMTRPERISGPVPQYTKEALEKRSEGLMVVKCVLTAEGEMRKCRIIKPVPLMEEAVLDALHQSPYKPVTFERKPIEVDYTFNIRLSLPEPAHEG